MLCCAVPGLYERTVRDLRFGESDGKSKVGTGAGEGHARHSIGSDMKREGATRTPDEN